MAGETNQEFVEMKELHVGDSVKSKAIKVEDKLVIVDIGYKVDGIVPISELSSLHVEKAGDVVKVGDEFNLEVIKVDEEEIVLSKRRYEAKLAWEDLKEKFANGDTFNVTVKEIVNGGLVVDIGVRGFIPASLVERHFVESFDEYKGRTLAVKVVELDEQKNRVILSHRAVLDDEATSNKQRTLASIQVGQIIEGKVQRLTDFGAFVDLGGIDGLVHISQIAHHHIESPSEVLKEGQLVNVKVLSVDPNHERVSLSIKETLPGPWEQMKGKIQAGDVVEGKVRRLVSFGAFVEIAPGVEGLVHISQISTHHIGTPNEVLKEGETVKAKVLEVNMDEKRISLSIRALEDEKKSANDHILEKYQAQDDTTSGFSLGDMIGEQLKKLK